jgi:hypothetical protein
MPDTRISHQQLDSNVFLQKSASNTSGYKGVRCVTIGYGGTIGTGRWIKLYHGEGVEAGSANTIVLKLSCVNYLSFCTYSQWGIQWSLTQTSSLLSATVTQVSGKSETAPVVVISGDATSYDVWLQAAARYYWIEFEASDEVSANDTLVTPVFSQAESPTVAISAVDDSQVKKGRVTLGAGNSWSQQFAPDGSSFALNNATGVLTLTFPTTRTVTVHGMSTGASNTSAYYVNVNAVTAPLTYTLPGNTIAQFRVHDASTGVILNLWIWTNLNNNTQVSWDTL